MVRIVRTVVWSLLALVVLLPASAQAATLTVCPTAPAGCQHATIQAAVDAAAVDDVIQVAAGTYAESVTIAKQVTVRGPRAGMTATALAALDDAGGATVTGAGAGAPAFTLSGGAAIDGLTVTGVVGDDAAGIVIAGYARAGSVRVHDNTIGVRFTSALTYYSSVGGDIFDNDAPGIGSGVGVEHVGAGGLHVGGIVRDHAVAAIVARPAVATTTSFLSTSAQMSGSPTAIDVRRIGRVEVGYDNPYQQVYLTRIDVPAGGTGIRVGAQVPEFVAEQVVVSGAVGRAGTTGVELRDGVHEGGLLREVDLLDLDVALRIDPSHVTTSRVTLDGARVRQTGVEAAIVGGGATVVDAGTSHFGCSSAPCVAQVASGVTVDRSGATTLSFDLDDSTGLPETVLDDTTRELRLAWRPPTGYRGEQDLGASRRTPITLSVTGATIDSTSTRTQISRYYDPDPAPAPLTLTPGPPGSTIVVTATFDGVTYTSTPIRVLGRSPALLTAPTVVGDPTIGNSIRCEAGTWAQQASGVTYEWVRGWRTDLLTRLHTGQSYTVTLDDWAYGDDLYCRVRATFPSHLESSGLSTPFRPKLIKRKVHVLPLSPRGRVIGCGSTIARACVLRRGALVRFAIAGTPVQALRATWIVELRVGRRWKRATSGQQALPSRYYIALRTNGAPRTVYRIRAAMPAKNAFGPGRSAWRYWRLR